MTTRPLPTLDDQIREIASHCGDCGKVFDDAAGNVCYVRQQPARLICMECKAREDTEPR